MEFLRVEWALARAPGPYHRLASRNLVRGMLDAEGRQKTILRTTVIFFVRQSSILTLSPTTISLVSKSVHIQSESVCLYRISHCCVRGVLRARLPVDVRHRSMI